MKKLKKILAIMLTALCVCMLLVPSCSAATTSFSRHVNINSDSIDDDRFTYEWEHTRRFYANGTYRAKLVYGYDTDWVNEDYAWSEGEYRQTKAGLKRANDGSGNSYDTSYTWSDYAAKGEYSKCELTHTRDNVYYKCTINYDYSSIGSYTYSTTTNTTERDY